MDKLSMLKELLLRLRSDSPDFFNKIKNYSIFIAIAAAIPIGLEWAEVLVLPGKLDLILTAIVTFFLGSGGTATLPVKTMDGPGGTVPPPGNPKPPGG